MQLRSVAGWAKAGWEQALLGVKALLVFVGVLGAAALGYGAYHVLVRG
ncbi:MAG: hypothetical protein M3R24_20955 [Chloroflexota bacterium]|nr:hypothetical protein [Chloroflexota bacterium]